VNLLSAVADGFVEVRAHAARTVLQTLGVVLGVASVVSSMGLFAGGRAQSLKYYSQSGGVLKVTVYPKDIRSVTTTARERASRGLTIDDMEAVKASVTGFDLIEPVMHRSLQVRTATLTRAYDVTGVGSTYGQLQELLVGGGRFINENDVAAREAVCVLGANRAREFFGTLDPVGQKIRLGDHLYTVVGQLTYREFYWNKRENYNSLDWMNDFIIVPVTALQGREAGAAERKIGNIALRLVDRQTAEKALPALRRVLLRRHGVEDFQVYARYERMKEMDQQAQVYDLTFKAVGLISLIVGGIVVANILMASFRERVCEIGVRKAVGAKGWHIAVQFLVESVVVSGIGGALGLAVGVGFVHVIAWLLDQYAVLTPAMIAAAVSCACGVGVVSGFIPAIVAARLDPVVALRYE
jgi:ABC-type antimicrobial peptide transport system permease subunit